MKRITFFFSLLVMMAAVMQACNGQDKGGSGIKGTIADAANLQVSLDLAHFDRSSVALGKAACDANGKFDLQLEKPFEEGLYRLTVGAKRIYFILNGKEKQIEITGNLATLDKMQIDVKGSETFTCYANLIQEVIKTPLQNPEAARAIINRGCTTLMQAFLTTQLLGQNAGQFLQDFKSQNMALGTAMPGSKYANDYAKMITQIEAQMNQQQAGDAGSVSVGQMAPEITSTDPSGKTRSLSSMKGKVVLLDFWASWCGPCRRENPHVVEVYNKYKSKGFDVFSVSLDRNDGKQKWIDAIKQDGLVWENHVSDLQWWQSAAAQTYGVNSIPRTFLLDRTGKIIAVNPRENLEQAVQKAL